MRGSNKDLHGEHMLQSLTIKKSLICEYVIGLAWPFLSSHRRPPTTLHRPIKRCCKLDDDDEVGMSGVVRKPVLRNNR